MTTTKRLVLWVKQGDPPSERAKLAAASLERILPAHIAFEISAVDENEPCVSRVPTLLFYLGPHVVYSIEGDITLDSVVAALRRLG